MINYFTATREGDRATSFASKPSSDSEAYNSRDSWVKWRCWSVRTVDGRRIIQSGEGVFDRQGAKHRKGPANEVFLASFLLPFVFLGSLGEEFKITFRISQVIGGEFDHQCQWR